MNFRATKAWLRPWRRAAGFVLPAVVVIAYVLAGGARAFWSCYWLTTEAKQSIAMIAKEHAHGVVDYKYSVRQQEYKGTSQRHWEQEKYRNVHVGEESIVFFSSSRPWISSLETPSFPPRMTLFFIIVPLVLGSMVFVSLKRSRESSTADLPTLGGIVTSTGVLLRSRKSSIAELSTPLETPRSKPTWYQHVWLALPFALLVIGGVVGGACGGAAWVINLSVFKKTEHPILRYVWTGLISVVAVIVYLTLIFVALSRKKG